MEENYVAKLMLSILVFAPGLVVLFAALFVGLLVLLEKAGVLGTAARRPLAHAAGPVPPSREVPAGPVVEGFKQAVEAESAAGGKTERSSG